MSVMLVTACGAAQVFAEDKDRKEKMRIIVVEKRERDKSGGETRQGRPGDRKPQQ
ncbi:MAG TPA: hypothetical protein VKA60_13195 [Blastocatellia bacterium]|nr:hypothetical protein [Blastocatellia bacterium]